MISSLPFFFPIDSYKLSHYFQYPSGVEKVHCYMEARSANRYDRVFFYGLEYYLNLLKKWTTDLAQFNSEDKLKHYKLLFSEHGFNQFDLQLLINLANYIQHNHSLPLKIYAHPEGQVYPVHTPLICVENTHTDFFWLPTFLETFLLKIWYPTTVATKSYFVKQILLNFWEQSSDSPISGVDFQFHNFGDRGSSSTETAYIGGRAHLQLFRGTDNFMAIIGKNSLVEGFSIPAMEHASVCAWGREGEYQSFVNMLELSRGYEQIAMVVDSYNTYEAVKFIIQELRAKIESEGYPKVWLRPDSGDPLEVLPKIIQIMQENRVSTRINNKGYMVWEKFGLIWGDGIDDKVIVKILQYLKANHYSSENIAFGSGGWLMQQCSRDTLGFAYKASAILKDEVWHPIYKAPMTDPQKHSKGGRHQGGMQQVY